MRVSFLCSGNRMSLLCSNIDGSFFFTAYTLLYMTATSCTTSSFVYLKSFKELFLFRGFRSLSKAFAKLGAFFETTKLFRKFFSKSFFWRRKLNPSGCRSRSLNAVKVRYLDRRRTAASCSVSFQIVISSTSFPLESGCKITHFFAFSNFYGHFFSTFLQENS